MIKERPVLVIKLGALGDFVQALGPFSAIRTHHADQRIALLTTPPFVPIAEASGYFDDIRAGIRPAWWQFGAILELRRWLRDLNPTRVYDLQTSDRSSAYFKLFASPKPEWSGIAAGCSHPHAHPRGTAWTVDIRRTYYCQAQPGLGFDVSSHQFLLLFAPTVGAKRRAKFQVFSAAAMLQLSPVHHNA